MLSAFWLALQLSADAARARLLIWCVVGISAAYAAVGLFALGFMPGGRVFAELEGSKFFSTFGNRNHFATFAGIGLIAALGQIVRLIAGKSSPEAEIFCECSLLG